MANTNNERVDKALDVPKESICGNPPLLTWGQNTFAEAGIYDEGMGPCEPCRTLLDARASRIGR